MAYAFEPGETVQASVTRVMGEQLERIETHLAERDVHDARKRIKEVRALLRMIRQPLAAHFAIENSWYRDAARDLSTARDAEAVRESLHKLEEAQGRQPGARKLLGRRRRRNQRDLQGRIDNLLAQLPAARARIATWPMLADRFSAIGAGAERTLRDGRAALEHVLTAPSPEAHHELRKRVKDHWYHVQLLRKLWPDVLKGEAAAIEELSDALGDHHDLHLLALALGSEAPAEAIAKQRADLEATALGAARRLFSESPDAWRKRIRGYWRVTR